MVRKNTISPGRWSLGEDIDSEADRILREARVGNNFVPETIDKPIPYFSDDLIQQYDFFRRNIY